MLSDTEPKLHTRARYLLSGFLIPILIVAAFVIGFWMRERESMPVLSSQGLQNLATTLTKLPGYEAHYLYRDEDFERISRIDASFTYAYLARNVSNPTIYLLIGVGDSLTNLHSWEVDLVSWGTAQGSVHTVFESKDVQLVENPPITARFLVFQYPSSRVRSLEPMLQNQTQVTLYWYQKALFDNGTTIQQKYVQITLAIYPTRQEDYKQLEQTLLILGQSIAEHW